MLAAGVKIIGESAEPDIATLEFRHQGNELAERIGYVIERPNKQRLPVGEICEQGAEAWVTAALASVPNNDALAANALDVQSLFTTFFFLKSAEIRELLGIPPQIFMECAVFLGYGDEPLGKPKRKPVPDVTHLNTFGNRYELTPTD